jgi:hypothetical protein
MSVADASIALGGVTLITSCVAFVFARTSRVPTRDAIAAAALNGLILGLFATAVLVLA